MLSSYLHKDILQYIFNLYVNYENDAPKLEKIINFKFDIKQHLYIEETCDPVFKHKIISTYIDDNLTKQNSYFIKSPDEYESKIREHNYKNGKLNGKQYAWYDNGKLEYLNIYKDNFIIFQEIFDLEGKTISKRKYVNYTSRI